MGPSKAENSERIPTGRGKSSALAEACQQLLVDAVELAVGEDGDDVAVVEVGDEAVDDRVGIEGILGHFAIATELRDDRVGIEALALVEFLETVDARDENAVSQRERFGQLVLEDVAAGGVAARFEERPQSPLRVFFADGANRLGDGGRVMREIIEHGNARLFPADFHAPLDAGEGGEPALDLVAREAQFSGAHRDGGGIALIVIARERHDEIVGIGFREKADAALRPATTSRTLASSPLAMIKPRRGTIATSWRNARFTAARSGKISA